MSLEYDTIEDEITCPYCGNEGSDSWERGEEDDNAECDECGKNFAWVKEFTVEYKSAKDCSINDTTHDFEIWQKHPNMRGCKECEYTEYNPDGWKEPEDKA